MRVFVLLQIFIASYAFKPRTSARMPSRIVSETDAMPRSQTETAANELRKSALPILAGFTVFSGMLNAWAEDVAPAVETKVELGPPPEDFGITNDYYADCARVVKHMRYASQIEKGNPIIVEFAGKTKDEMNEFVSSYRRFSSVAGKQSFSLLYTSISVLAGHYTSYGLKFPVPEKRRKRLLQELNDIEKNIKKKR